MGDSRVGSDCGTDILTPWGQIIAFVDHGELPSKIADRLGSTKPIRTVR